MGLFGLDEDASLGLLTAALAAMSSSGVRPGTALARGGLLGINAMQGAKQGRADAARQQREDEYRQMQMDEYRKKVADSQSAAEQAREQQKQLAGVFSGAPQLGQMGGGGPTPENAARVTPDRIQQYRQAAAIFAQQGRTEDAKRMDDIADRMQESFSQTPQTLTQGGRPVAAVLGNRGTVKPLEGYGPKPENEVVDFGGSKGLLDKLTGTVGQSWNKTVGPDTIYQGDITKRGQNMTDARAREAARVAAAGGGKPSIHDGQLVYLPSEKYPQGTAIPIPGYQQKMPEAIRKELSSIDAQLMIVDRAINDVTTNPSAFSMSRGLATLAGTVPESAAGRFDSKPERETRAFVFNTVSKTINERAGAAQSKQELARLRSFLPSETDNAEQVVDKFNAFKEYLIETRAGYEQHSLSGQPARGASGEWGEPRVKAK